MKTKKHFGPEYMLMFWYYFIIGKKEHSLDVRKWLKNDLLCINEELYPKCVSCGYKLINNSIYFPNTNNFLPNVKGNKQKIQNVKFYLFNSLSF